MREGIIVQARFLREMFKQNWWKRRYGENLRVGAVVVFRPAVARLNGRIFAIWVLT